ncbi:MAG: hypothetical protein WAT39_17580 [Planctomycetota bacterium]
MQSHLASRSLLFATLLAAAATAQITPGNLVVVRVGDGSAALTSASTAAFLDEYTSSGALVQSIPLPTAPAGANLPATVAGSATSEGFLTQSSDGRYLVCTGYAAGTGVAAIAGTTSAATPRVIARIALNGTIDSSTSINNLFSAGNIRSATTEDGSQFWAAGSNSGVVLAPMAGTTGTQISTTVTNLRVLSVTAGQLYTSSGSGTTTRCVSTVGTGAPTTSGQVITILNGMTSGVASPYDYWFADANTLYVADDRLSALGGIQKWTQAAGTWTLQYTMNPALNIGCRGLSGCLENGVATLFATTTNNLLVTATDTGVASVFSTVVTGVTNTALRGVRLVRTPYNTTFSGTACATSVGVPTVGTSGGLPITGNLAFAIAGGNAPPLTFVLFSLKVGAPLPFGIPVPGAPACVAIFVPPDVLLGGGADIGGNASTPLPVPANCSLGGASISAQFVPFDLTLVGFTLPIGSSNAMEIVIGN